MTVELGSSERLRGFFLALTARPGPVVAVGLLFVIAAGAGLTQLVKDTSVDAFVPDDHPSLLANERVEELFGLTDSLAIAVFTEQPDGVFSQPVLALIDELTDAVAATDNVRSDRVVSLTTESSISGSDGAINVDAYFSVLQPVPAELSRLRWQRMPPHIDSLVSPDGSAAVIMAEVVDASVSADTYLSLLELADAHQHAGIEIAIAGPAAVSGYLSKYIDADARVLQPVVFVVVLLFVYLAFLRSSALLGPLLVLLGAAGGSLGLMAWLGVSYYAITNALPVILVAISVADAIHVLSAYFANRSAKPEASTRDAVVDAMVEMARPITLTTVTTIAGFFGIAAVSIMPPIVWFAVFAMLGVALAWAFSLLVLPAALVLLAPQPSRLFAKREGEAVSQQPGLAQRLGRVSSLCAERAGVVASVFALLIAGAAYLALDLKIDRSQVDNFAPGEPIREADERIGEAFAGTAFLDVIIESEEPDGLLSASAIEQIAALQTFLERQPHVSKTVSIVDYLALLHSAVNGTAVGATRALPHSDGAVAQYLMVYEASGDPSDFDEEITPDYRSALVRVVLNSSWFSDSRIVVEELQRYLDREFAGGDLRATIAGDVNVAYHWMTRLTQSHFVGVALSLLLILAMAVVVFRSLAFGVVAVLPVSVTVLCLYAVMATLGINLEPATSMFAAISVGVGVDFAIHLLAGLQAATGSTLAQRLQAAAPAIARACFFNAAALGVGFSVLMLSDLPTLQRFGGLVCVAAVASFVCALVLVPAALALIERFGRRSRSLLGSSAAVGLLLVAAAPDPVAADLAELPAERFADGGALAAAIAERPEARATRRFVSMQLTDKRGRERQRKALVLRQNEDDQRTTRITYLEPKAVRELTFLSADARDSDATDKRWLYIPAAGKVRRVPPSDRGDYFLGTDFTFEDIQSDFRFDATDYAFELGEGAEDGLLRLVAVPHTDRIARELGYGRVEADIDPLTLFPKRVVFHGVDGEPLKHIEIDELVQIDGIWTPLRIEARHLRSQHATVFEYADVSHLEELPARLLRASELDRGLPAGWDTP